MTSKSLVVAALLALGCSCQQKLEGALRVDVTTASALMADCLRVSVFDGDTELRWVTFKRLKNQPVQSVGIVRAEGWPKTVSIAGSAWLGDCADEAHLVRNAVTARQVATFPETEVLVLELRVDLPSASEDVDRDGYSTAADCNDNDRTINPGSTQVCDRDVDTDCDGLIACADPDCSGSTDCANPPDRLEFTGLPTAPQQNDCADFQVALRNPQTPRGATARTVVSLASTPPIDLFDGPGCAGQPITQAVISFRALNAPVSARLSQPGAEKLTATATGLTAATATLTVEPTPWTMLQLANVPATLAAGACGGPMTLSILDGLGRPTVVNQALTMTLASTPTTSSALYTTADCSGSAISTLDIAAGSGSATFYLRATKVGAVKLTATANTVSANGSVSITAGEGRKLALANAPLGLRTSDTCSAGALQIEVHDDFDNLAASPRAVTLTPSADLNGVTFFDGSTACTSATTSLTLAQGASTLSFRMRASTTGAGTVRVLPSTFFSELSQAFTVGVGDPTTLLFTNPSRSIVAGNCSAELTLELRDASGTPSSFGVPNSVTLSTSTLPANSGLTYFTQAGCTGTPMNPNGNFAFPAGQSQARLYFTAQKVIATFSVSATLGTLNGASAGHSVSASTPSVLLWDAPTSASASAGTCSSTYTLRLFDRFGNSTAFSAATPLAVTSNPPGLTFDTAQGQCAGSALTFPAGSTVGLQAKGTTTGTYSLTASAGGASTTSAATLTVTPNTSTSLVRTFPTSTPTVTAGTCQQLTFARQDSFGNPAPATPLTVSASVSAYDTLVACQASTGALTSFPVTGNSRSVWVQPRSVAASPVTITATLGGNSTTATVAVTAAAAAQLAIEGLPASRASNACVGPVTLHRRDAFGNDALNDGALAAAVSGPASVSTRSSADCSGASAQTATASFSAGQAVSSPVSLSAALVGTYTIQADAGVPLTASSSFTVTAGPPAQWIFDTTPPASLETTTCSGGLRVHLADAAGNPLSTSGVAVTLSSSPATVTFSGNTSCTGSTAPLTNSSGVATFSFTAPNAPQTLSVSAASVTTNSQTWTIVAGPPRQLAWKVAPPGGMTSFVCSPALTLELRDNGGNVVNAASAITVTPVGTGLPNFAFFTDATCQTPAPTLSITAGTSEVTFYAAATGSGAGNISATAASAGLTAAGAQPVTVSGSSTALTLAAAATDLEAGGCLQLTATRGALTLGTTTVSFTGLPASGVTLHSSNDCSTASQAATFAIPNGASSVTLYARGRSVAVNTSFNLGATDGSGGLLPSNLVAMTTYPLVRRGTCSIANGSNSNTCDVSLPFNDISRTLLIFTATSSANTAQDGLARCYLQNPVKPQVVCDRRGTNGDISVLWQTASWGRSFAQGGVTVEHRQGTITAGTTSVSPITVTAVNPASSFVLFSSNSGSNKAPDAPDFYEVELSSATQVQLTGTDPFPGTDYAVQVVQVAGSTVDRGKIVPTATTAATTRNLALTSPLISGRTPSINGMNANEECRFRVRAYLNAGAVTIHHSSACTVAVYEVAYELIEWPAGTTVDLPPVGGGSFSLTFATTSTATTTFSPAVGSAGMHKTLVYSAGQGASGQSSGSTSSHSNQSGAGLATIDTVKWPIELTRTPDGNASSSFTPYAITLNP